MQTTLGLDLRRDLLGLVCAHALPPTTGKPIEFGLDRAHDGSQPTGNLDGDNAAAMADLVFEKSVIDAEASVAKAVAREIDEEVTLNGAAVVNTRRLDKVVAADVTGVDAKHIAMVTIVELDKPLVESNEEELETIGFLTPRELLDGDYHLETWAEIICKLLDK